MVVPPLLCIVFLVENNFTTKGALPSHLACIFHEKEVVNPFQAFKIRLNANSKKGIRRDRLYTHPAGFPRFQTS